MTEAHPMNSCGLIHHLAEGGQARVGYQVPMLNAVFRQILRRSERTQPRTTMGHSTRTAKRVGTAEVPHIADGIAAAPRTGGPCQIRK